MKSGCVVQQVITLAGLWEGHLATNLALAVITTQHQVDNWPTQFRLENNLQTGVSLCKHTHTYNTLYNFFYQFKAQNTNNTCFRLFLLHYALSRYCFSTVQHLIYTQTRVQEQ